MTNHQLVRIVMTLNEIARALEEASKIENKAGPGVVIDPKTVMVARSGLKDTAEGVREIAHELMGEIPDTQIPTPSDQSAMELLEQFTVFLKGGGQDDSKASSQ